MLKYTFLQKFKQKIRDFYNVFANISKWARNLKIRPIIFSFYGFSIKKKYI